MPQHTETPSDETHHERMERQFGRVAALYATSEHKGGRDLERLVELAQPAAGDRALDIATGAGHVAVALAPNVGSVIATDVAEGMLAEAKAALEATGLEPDRWCVRFADAERLPFEDGSFELVTCRIAPHHFAHVGRWLQETARVLVPGGRLVIVDSLAPDDPTEAAFLHEVEVLRDPTHVKAYSRREWATMLEGAGFDVEAIEVARKHRDFERWLERGSVDAATATFVRTRFLEAGAELHAAFDIEVAEGAVTSFADDKVVIAARRR